MENQQEPSRDSFDSLALARKHVRALTDGGLSREALLRALLEQEEASNSVPPLPTQQQRAPKQPLSITTSLSRSASLAQPKSRSHWSISTRGRSYEESDRTPSPDQTSLSSAAQSTSGSRSSYLSTHTTATSLSDRSSTITQFPGHELPGGKPSSISTRAYWCTSCDTEFKRKFDWKRHEDEFHERYKKYPCPDCNRVFWGANTFNQHHKTRHNCKTCPHADKVIKYTRKKRAWACGFCAAFLPSMDRYIDHIGLHYESGRTKAHWYHSNVIYGLLHQPGINSAWKSMVGSRFSHIPKEQQPYYYWDVKTTGRKQGFLENETAGNLQDLLEFFQPTKDDPAQVAGLALESAELMPATSASRSSLEVPGKGSAPGPPPPPPGLKRENTTSTLSSSSKRKPTSSGSGGGTKELAPTPVKSRPLTQWPGIDLPDMPLDGDVQMGDYADPNAAPPPLFASSISPPPYQQHQHHHAPTSIAISPGSDRPTFLTPTTPLSQTASAAPFHHTLEHQPSRDTVIDLLSDYMSQEPMQGQEGMSQEMHHQQQMACQQQQQQQQQHQQQQQQAGFTSYEDWNSICSTMVGSPRHNNNPNGGPLTHEQRGSRRSDFWAGGGSEGLYIQHQHQQHQHHLPPVIHEVEHDERRSDVWAARSVVDYEGMGYEDEIAGAPPPSSNWL